MNIFCGMGRLTKDPTITDAKGMKVARYTLAIDRRGKKGEADFISCVCFDKPADFAERYLKKGTKIAVEGRIQTGSYTNREGNKVYTTDVIVHTHHFCEGKAAADSTAPADATPDSFMTLPDGIDDEIPFG